MQIQISLVKGLCNVYLIKHNDKVIVVDAGADLATLREAVGDFKVVGIIITHGHYDHILNLPEMIKHFKVKCFLHKNAINKLINSDTNCSGYFGLKFVAGVDKSNLVVLDEGEINLLDRPIRIIFTPGHTDCGVSIEVDGKVFTGDTLFRNGVGRTDLPTSNEADLLKSLDKIKENFKGCRFFPGHGEEGIV